MGKEELSRWPAPSNFAPTWVTLPTTPIASRQEKKNKHQKNKRDATADKLRREKESTARKERRKRAKPSVGK